MLLFFLVMRNKFQGECSLFMNMEIARTFEAVNLG